jgi:large subunit ribosomal protein L32
MAVPFRRTSKTRRDRRRNSFKLTISGLVACDNCGEPKMSHRVCPKCGHYKKRQVVQNA